MNEQTMCECKSPFCSMHRRPRMLVVLLAVLVIYFGVKTIGEIKKIGIIGKDIAPQTTISVSGEGERFAKPDLAILSFTVRDTKNTVADAQKTVTAKIDAVETALKALGIAGKDIKTAGYTMNPHYEFNAALYPCPAYNCPPGKQVLTGYEVVQTVEVKIRTIDSTGAVLGKLGELGVTEVGSVSFSIENEDAIKAEARGEAIAKAKEKAQTLADQLGVSLARVVSFSESNGGGGPIYMMKAENASAGTAVPTPPSVPVGENRIVSDVTVTYEIR
ncbi:MAG: SIMPL domain-containing protein [Minisyncoccota bacterium]